MSRMNPFENLDDFTPKASTQPPNRVEKAQIERLSQENGFPSRQPRKLTGEEGTKRRRYTTGRNQQINIKATAETISRLYRIADQKNVPLGEILDRALDALEHAETGSK
jgi:hypothetical protein